MTGVYSETKVADLSNAGPVAWERVHANGERTQVYVLPAGERYVAVAVDVDPVEFTPGDADTIGFSPTESDARAHATRWMEQNPRGVAGDGKESGVVGSLLTGLQKLDQSANPANQNDTEDTN